MSQSLSPEALGGMYSTGISHFRNMKSRLKSASSHTCTSEGSSAASSPRLVTRVIAKHVEQSDTAQHESWLKRRVANFTQVIALCQSLDKRTSRELGMDTSSSSGLRQVRWTWLVGKLGGSDLRGDSLGYELSPFGTLKLSDAGERHDSAWSKRFLKLRSSRLWDRFMKLMAMLDIVSIYVSLSIGSHYNHYQIYFYRMSVNFIFALDGVLAILASGEEWLQDLAVGASLRAFLLGPALLFTLIVLDTRLLIFEGNRWKSLGNILRFLRLRAFRGLTRPITALMGISWELLVGTLLLGFAAFIVFAMFWVTASPYRDALMEQSEEQDTDTSMATGFGNTRRIFATAWSVLFGGCNGKRGLATDRDSLGFVIWLIALALSVLAILTRHVYTGYFIRWILSRNEELTKSEAESYKTPDPKLVLRLAACFQSLDVDNRGFVNTDDIRVALEQRTPGVYDVLELEPYEVGMIFKSLEVDLGEFMSAVLREQVRRQTAATERGLNVLLPLRQMGDSVSSAAVQMNNLDRTSAEEVNFWGNSLPSQTQETGAASAHLEDFGKRLDSLCSRSQTLRRKLRDAGNCSARTSSPRPLTDEMDDFCNAAKRGVAPADDGDMQLNMFRLELRKKLEKEVQEQSNRIRAAADDEMSQHHMRRQREYGGPSRRASLENHCIDYAQLARAHIARASTEGANGTAEPVGNVAEPGVQEALPAHASPSHDVGGEYDQQEQTEFWEKPNTGTWQSKASVLKEEWKREDQLHPKRRQEATLEDMAITAFVHSAGEGPAKGGPGEGPRGAGAKGWGPKNVQVLATAGHANALPVRATPPEASLNEASSKSREEGVLSGSAS